MPCEPSDNFVADDVFGAGEWVEHENCTVNGFNRGTVVHHKNFHNPGNAGAPDAAD